MEKVNCKILRLFILVSLIFPYIAFCASSAIRVLPGTYTAGETFDVSVSITPVSNATDLILTETLPAGWAIVAANPGVSKPPTNTNSYKWLVFQHTPPISPFTITYTVHVPEGTTGTHQIIGSLHTYWDDVAVTGNSVIVDQYLDTSVSMSFEQGWNLICLPVKPATPITAQDFLDILNTYGAGATEINRWYNGAWQAHINGLPFNNFTLNIGQGYFVKCDFPAQIDISGIALPEVVISFSEGWNLVGIPAGAYTAKTVLDKINSILGNATEINRWNNGAWQAYINELPFNNDFHIESYCGYLIRVNQTCVCGF